MKAPDHRASWAQFVVVWGVAALLVPALGFGPASVLAGEKRPPNPPPPILDIEPPDEPVKREKSPICNPKKADESQWPDDIEVPDRCGDGLHEDWMWPVKGLQAMFEKPHGWRSVQKLEAVFTGNITVAWVLTPPAADGTRRVVWQRNDKALDLCQGPPIVMPLDCTRGEWVSLTATLDDGERKAALAGRIKYAVPEKTDKK